MIIQNSTNLLVQYIKNNSNVDIEKVFQDEQILDVKDILSDLDPVLLHEINKYSKILSEDEFLSKNIKIVKEIDKEFPNSFIIQEYIKKYVNSRSTNYISRRYWERFLLNDDITSAGPKIICIIDFQNIAPIIFDERLGGVISLSLKSINYQKWNKKELENLGIPQILVATTNLLEDTDFILDWLSMTVPYSNSDEKLIKELNKITIFLKQHKSLLILSKISLQLLLGIF